MTSTAELRQQLLDLVAEAVDDLGRGLAGVGEAYEQLDEGGADRLEEALFRPLQIAYGRAQRAHASFAARHALPPRPFAPAESGGRPQAVAERLEHALGAVGSADERIADLQDSMLPVEVGDPEVREALAEVRRLLAALEVPAREFTRRLGR